MLLGSTLLGTTLLGTRGGLSRTVGRKKWGDFSKSTQQAGTLCLSVLEGRGWVCISAAQKQWHLQLLGMKRALSLDCSAAWQCLSCAAQAGSSQTAKASCKLIFHPSLYLLQFYLILLWLCLLALCNWLQLQFWKYFLSHLVWLYGSAAQNFSHCFMNSIPFKKNHELTNLNCPFGLLSLSPVCKFCWISVHSKDESPAQHMLVQKYLSFLLFFLDVIKL